MDKLISALVVAAVSAITVLAYKHPRSYLKLHVGIFFTSIFGFTSLSIWNAAVLLAATEIDPFIIVSEKTEAKALLHETMAPLWVFASLVLWMIYVVWLTYLPYLLKEEEAKHESDDE